MKNLKILSREVKTSPELKGVRLFAQNPDDPNEFYIYRNNAIHKFNLDTEKTAEIVKLSDILPTEIEHLLLDILVLSIQRNICLAFRTGELILIDIDRHNDRVVTQEIIPGGIAAVQLSPDQELIVIATNDYKTHLLYTSLEVITENALCSEYFGEREFITVGWGKKETQFHGSEGKAAAKIKPNFDNGIALNEQLFTVTWRGDGSFYAVGFVLESKALLKIYNREGVLQYTSEKQPGLECNFAWRPSGNLIATTQVFPNKYVVAFFEKNGLKHGEFNLPFKYDNVKVLSLMWSSDSDILSVYCKNQSTNALSLLLYTTSNYHWYLKQSLSFNSDEEPIIRWEDALLNFSGKGLSIFSKNGKYIRCDWVWCIDRSNGKSENDDAVVGVVDGNNILLTAFRYSVVPPPMSSIKIECTTNVNRIVFGPNVNSNNFCSLNDDNTISLYHKKDKNYNLISTTKIESNELITDMLWISADCIICISPYGDHTNLLIFSISEESALTMNAIIKVDEKIIALKSLDDKNALLQNANGKLSTFSTKEGLKSFYLSFPECYYQFDAITIEGEIIVVGMTHRNKFYINDVKIANNINSYFVHSNFLMLTTLQHQLLCCPLTLNEIKGLQRIETQKDSQDLYFTSRSIERGSSLVTVVACDTRTVLQMPRGNLEVIQPRALSLKIIEKHLDAHDYYSAFDLMRKQRINLNLICDHNLTEFLDHIDEFISKIDNPSWLSLFISDLDNQNVTNSLYATSYRNKIQSTENPEKIKLICDKMRCNLEKANAENKYLLPIITTYVKKNTMKDLEEVLLRIKEVRVANGKSIVSAHDALKYLLYMVNVDELYNIALGLFDFDLVMFVASKSQKDPKEYVPYLNNLKKMEENYMKFTINNDLKRYDSALKYLIESKSTKLEELLNFIKQHKLYKNALVLLANDNEQYLKVTELYANYLHQRKSYSEAGIMFKRCNNNSMAIDCFMEAMQWQNALYLARNEYTKEKLNEFKQKIADRLIQIGSYSDVLLLLEDSPNVEEKVSYAIEGKLFKESIHICQKHNRHDLIDKIREGALEQFESLSNLIEQNREQYVKQKARLLTVRENKLKFAQNYADEAIPNDCDLYSDTSSILGSTSSRSSGRSHRSGKNRRKHERKMISLKEGSRYEDIALVRALHILITGTYNLRKDVAELNYALYWVGEDGKSDQLQKSLEEVLNEMSRGLKEIWTPEFAIEGFRTNQSPDELNELDLSINLEHYLRIAPVIQECKWKLDF